MAERSLSLAAKPSDSSRAVCAQGLTFVRLCKFLLKRLLGPVDRHPGPLERSQKRAGGELEQDPI